MWQNSVGARLFRALLPVALALSMSAAILSAQAPARRFHVLVVDSYHQGFAWGEAQFAGIRDALTEGLGANAAELSVFHLDDRRFPQKRELTAAYFMALYGDHPLDLVVTTDNAAWDFMKESDWRLKRRIPLVFAGVNDFHDDGRAGSLLMTGIAENFLTGRAETIKAAIALLPEIKRILLILDTTATSLAIRNEFMTIRGQFPGVIFDFVTEEDIDAQVKLVAALRQGDILVPIGTHRDSSGTLISYEEAMERLSAACPVPSFGFIENRIGHGIVGGEDPHRPRPRPVGGRTRPGRAPRRRSGQPAARDGQSGPLLLRPPAALPLPPLRGQAATRVGPDQQAVEPLRGHQGFLDRVLHHRRCTRRHRGDPRGQPQASRGRT
jgi:hypothetical protein